MLYEMSKGRSSYKNLVVGEYKLVFPANLLRRTRVLDYWLSETVNRIGCLDNFLEDYQNGRVQEEVVLLYDRTDGVVNPVSLVLRPREEGAFIQLDLVLRCVKEGHVKDRVFNLTHDSADIILSAFFETLRKMSEHHQRSRIISA